MPQKKKAVAQKLSWQERTGFAAFELGIWAEEFLEGAKKLRLQRRLVADMPLSAACRKTLDAVPKLSKSVRTKLSDPAASFTVAEVVGMILAVARDLIGGDHPKTAALALERVSMQLKDGLDREPIAAADPTPAARKPAKPSAGGLFQFKITLRRSKPAIWRRIQVEDCTLDDLHEHIQSAMGWTNSHLHQFEISGERFGDPELLSEGIGDDDDFEDSTEVELGELMPKGNRAFRFAYEYDFGDGWEHDVIFEGRPQPVPGQRYPLCLEGALACPPEDVGGVGGYDDYLKAIADPKHEEHDELLEWNGPFDPKKFDAKAATKAMRGGRRNRRG